MGIRAKLIRLLKKSLSFGYSRYCPVCSSSLKHFKSYGMERRPDAMCPVCGSLERHRLLSLVLDMETSILGTERKSLLHISPDACISERLRNRKNIRYTSADLKNASMVLMDMTSVPFKDNSYDIVYCSHVLEHVDDDRKALSEISRIIKSRGTALIQVPIGGKTTIEDPDIREPGQRERLFGQSDHVRLYGLDFRSRLEKEGFGVRALTPRDLLSLEKRVFYGLTSEDEYLYICKKG